MSNRSPVCALFLTLAACVPAQPHDTGVRSRSDSDADSNGQGDTDTGDRDTDDTASEATCADLPWKQVEFGMDVACGLHIDGCVQCWGGPRGSILANIPDVSASDLAVFYDYRHDLEAEDWPEGCVIDANRRITCWAGEDYRAIATTAEPVADVAFGAYQSLAVILADGSMVVQSGREPHSPISDVSPPLIFADRAVSATRNGRLMIWQAGTPSLEETDLGPLDEWSWHVQCGGGLCGIRRDGSGEAYYSGEWYEIFRAGSGWVAFWSHDHVYLVQDAAGLVYEYDDTTGIVDPTPWFSEPVVSVASVDEATCGITADGWLECTGDMKDRFPPPGSYVLPR